MASSNIGVIQLNMFEPDTDSQEAQEELLLQGRLQVDATEW